jgi:hypothetical protein
VKHIDAVLERWIDRVGEFPRSIVEREETGCCDTAVLAGGATEGDGHTPPA